MMFQSLLATWIIQQNKKEDIVLFIFCQNASLAFLDVLFAF